MNWFTRTWVRSLPLQKKQALLALHGGCEHVEADPSSMVVVSYENDSFGREGYCACQACHDKAKASEDEENVVCHDCNGVFAKKDTLAWKWYDFYAPQGDEPLIICKACAQKTTHLDRVKRDREDYEAEFGE